jgi:enoyl-CoA hydratase/carnithine racemase
MSDVDDFMTRIGEAAGGNDVGLRAEFGDDRVMRIKLVRTPGNRMSWAMLDGLRRVAEVLQEPGPARAVLMTHSGEDFCQGADLGDSALAAKMAAGRSSRMELARAGAAMIRDFATLPIPLVVGAEGKAIGGGAGLWFAADFRVSSEQSTVCFPEVDRGMHLSWGLSALVAHEVGSSMARWLTVLGKEVLMTDLGRGVSEPVAAGEVFIRATALARELAAKPPLALRAILEVERRARRAMLAHCHDDAEVFADTVESRDFAEAMSAHFEKRVGYFEGK